MQNFIMDDIYFSDKKKDNRKSKSQSKERISADKAKAPKGEDVVSGREVKGKPVSTGKDKSFTDTDYSDENFVLEFKKKTEEAIKIPEYDPYGKKEAKMISSGREPQGKPVSSTIPKSRTPQGERVIKQVSQPSRVPKGKRKKKKSSAKPKIFLALASLLLVLVLCLGVYGLTDVTSDGIHRKRRGIILLRTNLAVRYKTELDYCLETVTDTKYQTVTLL